VIRDGLDTQRGTARLQYTRDDEPVGIVALGLETVPERAVVKKESRA